MSQEKAPRDSISGGYHWWGVTGGLSFGDAGAIFCGGPHPPLQCWEGLRGPPLLVEEVADSHGLLLFLVRSDLSQTEGLLVRVAFFSIAFLTPRPLRLVPRRPPIRCAQGRLLSALPTSDSKCPNIATAV